VGAGHNRARAQPHDRRGLLLVADPVYEGDDPRLTAVQHVAVAPQASDGRALIPPSRLSAPSVHRPGGSPDFGAVFAADVDQLTGLNATRDRLLALDWSKYRFIHMRRTASSMRGFLSYPRDSRLLRCERSRGRRCSRVADVSLQTLTADVAVFSACDTALGKEVLSEGLVGIGSTTLARGARAVVASLWPVSDEIGARLMTECDRDVVRRLRCSRPRPRRGHAMVVSARCR